jgi:hypothetical protein
MLSLCALQPYMAYLGVLYSMVTALAVNITLCVWVAWFFKEQKFDHIWPIAVLRLFSSIFFQAFDVSALNLFQVRERGRARESEGERGRAHTSR